MDTHAPLKGSASVQADFSKRRHVLQKDDLELNALGQAFLASLDESVRPEAVAVVFPRIVNRVARLWKIPRELDRYFEELLTDTRGNRKGFPLNVLMELMTLKDYYQKKVFPKRGDLWDA